MKLARNVCACVGIGIVAAFGTAGCGSSSSGGPASGGGASGALTVADIDQPTSWDPAKADPVGDAPYLQAVYDSLLTGRASGGYGPGLATKWTYDKSQTKLTLTLRQGVTFTDGEPVNAGAVVTNLEHYKTAHGPASADLASVTSVRAAGSNTVVISLNAPDPALLSDLAFAVGYVAAPKAIKDGSLATKPVGSGAYTLDSANTVSGSKYVFTRNPKTWQTTHFQTINIMYMPDGDSALNALRSGQLDAAVMTNPQSELEAKQAGYRRVSFGASTVGVVFFDRDGKDVPALKNVRVRQAIAYALNAKQFVDAFLGGDQIGTLTRQSFGPTSNGWEPSLDSAYPYNPAKARRLLAQAGYPHGFTVTMPYFPLWGYGLLDAVKAMLGKVGIKVNYQQITTQQVVPDLLAGKFPMAVWTLVYQDPWETMEQYFANNAPFNSFHVPSATVQGMIHRYQYASNAARPAIAKRLNAYLVHQAWTSWWAYGTPGLLVNSKSVKLPFTTSFASPSVLSFAPAAS